MFDFIWHLRGSVTLDGFGSDEIVLDSLEHFLDRQRKNAAARGADYLEFDDPLWSDPFGPNWLALGIYDRGRLWVEQSLDGRRLCYDLRSLHGMVFCLFGALMFFFFGLAIEGFGSGLKYAAGAFAWLYGMNVLTALVRVPRALRKAARSG